MLTSSLAAIDQWVDCANEITRLDPLRFDRSIATLHDLNRKHDVKAIVQMLYGHLPVPHTLDTYSYEESIAAMRDLGIFIGILKKLGVEPVDAIPELEYVLLVLHVKTSLPPRDTLIHYTMWNPSDHRCRSYTGLRDEIQLIESVKVAYPSLLKSIVILDALHEMDFESPEFSERCDEAQALMNAMVQGIVHAKRNVSPQVFANELRFYFDPIKVDYNKEYLGPGAVEMPMFVFDHLLWSSDVADETYVKFKEGYLEYNLGWVGEIYRRHNQHSPLVEKMRSKIDGQPSDQLLKSAASLLDLFTVLKSFRMPHKKVAKESYDQKGDKHKQNGSGGYAVSILDHIIHLQSMKLTPFQEQLAATKARLVYQ